MNTQHPIYQSEAKNLLFLFVYVAICAWLTHEALKRKKRTRHKRPEKVLIFGRDSTGLNLVPSNQKKLPLFVSLCLSTPYSQL